MKFNLYSLDRYGNNRIKKICAIEEDYFGNGILNVTAGTTGYCGGDSGHGGESFIKLRMQGGDLSASIDGEVHTDIEDLIISVGGDWELDALIEGLRYATEALELIANIKAQQKE